jgi:hypothetical protein
MLYRDGGVVGDLFEIGVHHGRSALLLSHMARTGEWVRVCDLFGAQSDNVSSSGGGTEAYSSRTSVRWYPSSMRSRFREAQ